MVQSTTEDELFTRSETQRAGEMLEKIYAKAGAGDNFSMCYYPGPHKFDTSMQRDAFDWFDTWLK